MLGDNDVPEMPAELPEEPAPPLRDIDDSDRGVVPAVAARAPSNGNGASPVEERPPAPIVRATASTPPAVARSGDTGPLRDLRRELAESHAVAVRTSNGVATLAASLKEVIQRQNRYDRGLNLNSFVAYVLFTALISTGFYMLYRSRADQLVTERDQAVRGRSEAINEVAVAKKAVEEREAAERKALEYWSLLASGKREEFIARYPEITHERFTPVEQQVFQKSVERARGEIVDASHAEGLEAFQGQQWKRAAASFKKGLSYEEEGPRAAQMRYYLGVSSGKLGDYAEASRQLELAIAGGAERSVGSDARWHLGLAFEQLRQFDRAKTEFDKFAATRGLHPYAPAARRKSAEMAFKLAGPRAARPAAPTPAAPSPAPAAPTPAAP